MENFVDDGIINRKKKPRNNLNAYNMETVI